MKGNQIDDLFRQKLAHQKLNPPPAAWSTLEQHLPTRKKKVGYLLMGIAASLLLIFTAGWLLTGQNADIIAPQTQAQVEESKTVGAFLKAEKTVTVEKSGEAKQKQMAKPALASPVARNKKDTPKFTGQKTKDKFPVAQSPIRPSIAGIQPIATNQRQASLMSANLNFDMVMPMDLSAYYATQNEDFKLARRKKKFRVINSIISIAGEVDLSKLSFSELRKAKNNFVEDGLKYGNRPDDNSSGEE